MTRVRVPGLVDVVLVGDPQLIRTLSEDPRLDRDYAGPGPLLNRMITGRVLRNLVVGGKPLPSVAPRRNGGSPALESQLEGPPPEPARDTEVDYLAAYIRGHAAEDGLGPITQEAVGLVFNPAYKGTPATWQAARTLSTAMTSYNPVTLLWYALTGAVGRAKKRLAAAVNGDLAGVHATGIAVHNLVEGLKLMRGLWRDPDARRELSPEAAAARCLLAPPQVLRRWTAKASTVLGEVEAGALTVFQLRKAADREAGHAMVFMTESWSRCPAHGWTSRLLAAIWARAQALEGRP